MSLTPEQRARAEIDHQLTQAGWEVQDFRDIDIHGSPGVAIREYRLEWQEEGEPKPGQADYLLYVEGKAIGVVEAKPAGHTLEGVLVQSEKYRKGLDENVPAWGHPLPFAYESTGFETQFTNGLNPDPRARAVFTFHRPEELRRLAKLDLQLRARLQQMPPFEQGDLWDVQYEAIQNLERSLAENRPRALLQMATGSGKTYTACSAAYRLIKHASSSNSLSVFCRVRLSLWGT